VDYSKSLHPNRVDEGHNYWRDGRSNRPGDMSRLFSFFFPPPLHFLLRRFVARAWTELGIRTDPGTSDGCLGVFFSDFLFFRRLLRANVSAAFLFISAACRTSGPGHAETFIVLFTKTQRSMIHN
jgi:hypothetical protein